MDSVQKLARQGHIHNNIHWHKLHTQWTKAKNKWGCGGKSYLDQIHRGWQLASLVSMKCVWRAIISRTLSSGS